jgi:hypothetical protein
MYRASSVFTTKTSEKVAVLPKESTAVMFTGVVPGAEGIPVNSKSPPGTPPKILTGTGFKARPAGRTSIEMEYGATPPDTST